MYTLHDAGTGACVIAAVSCADTALERLRGLLARPPLANGEALLLTPCSSVHTCFMTYAIDIVYVDRKGQVLKVVPALPPWRMSAALGAAMTFELAAGQAAACALVPGRRLQLVAVE